MEDKITIEVDVTELIKFGYTEKELRMSLTYWRMQKSMEKTYDDRMVSHETEADENKN